MHPETFRAWRPANDYARIERSLREQERELGLRAVPGHHYRLQGQERPDRSERLAASEVHRWQRTGEVPFHALVRQAAQRDFTDATSWQDLEARLGRKGLWLEGRGGGLVVTDGDERIKISRAAAGISALSSRNGSAKCIESTNNRERRVPQKGLHKQLKQASGAAIRRTAQRKHGRRYRSFRRSSCAMEWGDAGWHYARVRMCGKS